MTSHLNCTFTLKLQELYFMVALPSTEKSLSMTLQPLIAEIDFSLAMVHCFNACSISSCTTSKHSSSLEQASFFLCETVLRFAGSASVTVLVAASSATVFLTASAAGAVS